MSNTPIPQIDLKITSMPVTANSRRLTMTWSQSSVDDMRSVWGPFWPRRPDNPLDLLRDALDDLNYDPDTEEAYKGLWRWQDGRLATPAEVKAATASPEQVMVNMVADNMTAEIDREILRSLKNLS